MKIKKWKTLESEYLFNRPWLTVRRDKVELPDGHINPEHYVLEYPDWVNVLALTPEKRIVMIEQYRHGLDQVLIELPAGVIEKDETPLDAAKRELLEETGYGSDNWEILTSISQNPSTCNNLTHCFIAKDAEKISAQRLDSSEDISVKLMTINEVKNLLMADNMKQALMAASLWKFFAINRLI